jgi:diaminopimelate decarboxylase
VYDLEVVVERLVQLRALLDQLPVANEVAFAVKASPLVPVVSALVAAGAGLELMGWSEIDAARAARAPASRWVVQAPVARPDDQLAWMAGGATVVVRDLGQAEALAPAVGDAGPDRERSGGLLLRGHDRGGVLSPRHGIPMGSSDWSEAATSLRGARGRALHAGLHLHGRHLAGAAGEHRLRDEVAAAWAELARAWDGVETLDIGGGLPAATSSGWRPERWVDGVAALLGALDPPPQRLIVEPGTALVADAGRLVLPVTRRHGTGSGRISVAGSPKRLLPEWRGAWSTDAHAPLVARAIGFGPAAGRAGEPLAVDGPSCMGSDSMEVVPSADLGGSAAGGGAGSIEFEGAGAYHRALATGSMEGGGAHASVGYEGLGASIDVAVEQLRTTGWTVVRTDPDRELSTELLGLAEPLRLASAPERLRARSQSYAVDAEIWATWPHTDGARDLEPPSHVALRVLEADAQGAGADTLVRIDTVVADLERYGASEVLATLTSMPVPIARRGGGRLTVPLLARGPEGWEARWFRPAIDWEAMDPASAEHLTAAVAWVDQVAISAAVRVEILLEAGQALVFDNRRHLHWRSLIDPASRRRWERTYLVPAGAGP